jgi:hypothetical protein
LPPSRGLHEASRSTGGNSLGLLWTQCMGRGVFRNTVLKILVDTAVKVLAKINSHFCALS